MNKIEGVGARERFCVVAKNPLNRRTGIGDLAVAPKNQNDVRALGNDRLQPFLGNSVTFIGGLDCRHVTGDSREERWLAMGSEVGDG